MLESAEAARRLGVKRATLYAYVSRGAVASHPSPDGRGSLFDADDIERLARRARGARTGDSRLATVTTGVTQLRDDGPRYRDVPAVSLARTEPYEAVAELLWATDRPPTAWTPLPLRPPAELGPSDRLRWAAVMAGAGDPLRSDRRPEAVTSAARRLIATMVAGLDPATDTERSDGAPRLVLDDRAWPGSVASALTAAVSPRPDERVVRAVNGALVLLADHELATSTVAVRVAASTRADVYDAVLSGLGTMAGPLHGGASQLAHGLLVEAGRVGPERALDEALRWQGQLPGFGHSVYPEGDPRFPVLYELFEELADDGHRALVASMLDLADAQGLPAPNTDLVLAAITVAGGMPDDAGRTIFTVARVAGWVAHYLEELLEPPLRFRARAVYARVDGASEPPGGDAG